jgi:hypothetical protein
MTADNAPARAQQPLLRPPGLSASAQLMWTAVVLLVVLAVVAGVSSCGAHSGAPAKSSSPAASAAGEQRRGTAEASGPAAEAGLNQTCTGAPLKSQLATAVQGGASVIVAVGTLTGKSVTADPATAGAPAFYAMTLQSVQTLRGPAVASGATAWIPGPAPGTPAGPENSSLLAPAGGLFAIAWPKTATHDLVGPVLQLAPIVGADVVFTPSGCWDLTGLQPSQYQAGPPLRAVPGGANFGGKHQAAENGLYTVPLVTVKQIATSGTHT